MKTAYKFRMYPNKQQEASLDLTQWTKIEKMVAIN